MVSWRRVSQYLFHTNEITGKAEAIEQYGNLEQTGVTQNDLKHVRNVVAHCVGIETLKTTAVWGAGSGAIDQLLHYAIDHGLKPEVAQDIFNASLFVLFSSILAYSFWHHRRAYLKHREMFKENPGYVVETLNSLKF